jgi:hypothetical protein
LVIQFSLSLGQTLGRRKWKVSGDICLKTQLVVLSVFENNVNGYIQVVTGHLLLGNA